MRTRNCVVKIAKLDVFQVFCLIEVVVARLLEHILCMRMNCRHFLHRCTSSRHAGARRSHCRRECSYSVDYEFRYSSSVQLYKFDRFCTIGNMDHVGSKFILTLHADNVRKELLLRFFHRGLLSNHSSYEFILTLRIALSTRSCLHVGLLLCS